MNRRNVLCYCTSVYQILILSIMKEIYFGEVNIYVILEKGLSEKINLQNFHVGIGEVKVLSERASEYEIGRIVKEIFADDIIDTFYIFSWGGHGASIYEKIPSEVKVILLDEGMSTCEYKTFMTNAVGNIDFSKLTEIWMLDPKVSQNDKKVPEYRIEIERIFQNTDRFARWLQGINSIFEYQYKSVETDILFFDRYMVQHGRIPIKYERFIFESILKLTNNLKLCVKKHPSEEAGLAEWRFRKLPVTFYENSNVPWELVVFNYIFAYQTKEDAKQFPKILITTNTTSLFVTQNILATVGIEIPIIYINKLINKYIKDIEKVAEKTIDAYRMCYSERMVFVPETWQEFARALAECLHNYQYNMNIIGEIYGEEKALLENEYSKILKVGGNLLQRVRIEVGAMEEVKEYVSYSILGEEQYNVTIENIDKIDYIRLFPTDTPIVYDELVLDEICYYKNQSVNREIINRRFIMTNKTPYVLIDMKGIEKSVDRLTIKYTMSKEFGINSEAKRAAKSKEYFEMCIEWINLLASGMNLEAYCRAKHYTKIGVYGNWTIGKMLEKQIKADDIEVILIDQRKFEAGMCVDEAKKRVKEFDLIVVTLLYDYYNIKRRFEFEDNVISIEEFFENVRMG